jgi:heat shock protein beta
LADLGKPIPHLAKSVFVEKLDARGYEVLLLNEALDEIMLQNLRMVKYALWSISLMGPRRFPLIGTSPSKMSRRQGSNSGMKVQITTCSTSDRNNLSAIDLNPEEEKDQTKALEEKFQPLLDWLKIQIGNVVRDGKNKP